MFYDGFWRRLYAFVVEHIDGTDGGGRIRERKHFEITDAALAGVVRDFRRSGRALENSC